MIETFKDYGVESIYIALGVDYDALLPEDQKAKYNLKQSWLNYQETLEKRIKEKYKGWFPDALVDVYIPRDEVRDSVNVQIEPENEELVLWSKDVVDHICDEVYQEGEWLVGEVEK